MTKNISFDDAIEFIDKIIYLGATNKASDIHISPGKDKVSIKFRIGGDLNTLYTFSMDLFPKFINSMKIRCGMDISEQNHIQDGKIFTTFNINGKETGVNLRVSSLPSLYGENFVMRLLVTNSEFLNINSLGFSVNNTKELNNVAAISEGLVLVCGGTGSGKTTTLYALLNQFNPQKVSIFTLEDPIEYQVDGYVQSQIRNIKGSGNSSLSYTFEEGLVGILRQDPDVIMIGEIRRDNEAETCLEAANTGHIVFGTIHANNSVAAVTRIRQLGVDSYNLASGIKYILSQKLVKKICPHCRIGSELSKSTLPEKFAKYLKDEVVVKYNINPEGCEECKNKGYNGSVMLSEIMKIDDNIYNLLLKDASKTEIKEKLLNSGFLPIYIDGFNKALKGLCDMDEVLELEY